MSHDVSTAPAPAPAASTEAAVGPDPSQVTTPTMQVVAGQPSADDLAVIVAVLSALEAAPDATTRPIPAQHWATPRHVRRQYPRSWAASRLPS